MSYWLCFPLPIEKQEIMHQILEEALRIYRQHKGVERIVFTSSHVIRSEVVIPELSHVTITIPDIASVEGIAESKMHQLRDDYAMFVPVERSVCPGDRVVLYIEAAASESSLEHLPTEHIHYVDSSPFLPIDQAICDLHRGETVSYRGIEFGVTAEGKEIEVLLTVQDIQEKILPELDDNFARISSGYNSLAELSVAISHAAEDTYEEYMLDFLLSAAMSRLMDICTVHFFTKHTGSTKKHSTESPGSATDVTEHSDRISPPGNVEESVHSQGNFSPTPHEIKEHLILDALVKEYNITLTDNDIEAELVRQAREYELAPFAYMEYLLEDSTPEVLLSIGTALHYWALRAKALEQVLNLVTVKKESGTIINTQHLIQKHITLAGHKIRASQHDEVPPIQ